MVECKRVFSMMLAAINSANKKPETLAKNTCCDKMYRLVCISGGQHK